MCYPVKCDKCGKTTWAGCGKHKDMVMSKIPENERCICKKEKEKEPKKSISSSGNNNNFGNFTEIKSSKQFDSIIKGDTLVIADFYATWCGPCNAMGPIVNIILFISFLYSLQNFPKKLIMLNLLRLMEMKTKK